MSIRLNKEIKLDCCDSIILKYGSINRNDPQVIYITGKMWVCPKFEGEYESIVNQLYSNFKKALSVTLKNSPMFENKFILDFDINPNNLVYNKKKFFSISVFIKQNPGNIVNLKAIKGLIMSEFGYLFKELEYDLKENDFEITKGKCR